MLEYLSLMEPQTSGFLAGMQDSGKRDLDALYLKQGITDPRILKRMRCEKCKARKGHHVGTGDSKRWVWCSRCGGSGRLFDVGGMTETRRAKSDKLITPDYIASLLAVLPYHLEWSALVVVLGDERSAKKLMPYLIENVIEPRVAAWKLEEAVVEERIRGLAVLSIQQARTGGAYKITAREAGKLIRCEKSQWYARWEPRMRRIERIIYGWANEAGRQMWLLHRGESDRTGT